MARFGVKEVCDCTFYDMNDVPVLYLDTLKISNLSNDAERTYIRGGRSNSILMAFDYNRTSTFSITDALLNPKTVALRTGVELVRASQQVYKREVLTQTGGVVTFSETPVTDVRLYASPDGYSQEVAPVIVPVGTVTTTGGVSTATVVGGADGDQHIAYYQFASGDETEMMTIRSDSFSGTYKIVGDTVVTNYETKELESFQIIVHQCKINSAFEITMEAEGDPSVFEMTIDVMKPDTHNRMIEMIKY